MRRDGRAADALRPVEFQLDFTDNPAGSVLCSMGRTRVLCTVCVEDGVPRWLQGAGQGWVTAEYSMLPYSTHDRKQRDSSKGRLDGRSVEIQRLIGRSLRAVMDLKKLPGYTLWVDCDVLQADGGTRTASITGAYLAARLRVQQLIQKQAIDENPFNDSVGEISVGIYEDQPVLDLPYIEDRDASVDFNVVMTGSGQYV